MARLWTLTYFCQNTGDTHSPPFSTANTLVSGISDRQIRTFGQAKHSYNFFNMLL